MELVGEGCLRRTLYVGDENSKSLIVDVRGTREEGGCRWIGVLYADGMNELSFKKVVMRKEGEGVVMRAEGCWLDGENSPRRSTVR